MKFKSSILITILLLISTQWSAEALEFPHSAEAIELRPSAGAIELPPAYSERPDQPSLIAAQTTLVTAQPTLVTAEPTLIAADPQVIANQPVIIQRTITVCPQCVCSANNVIRVLVCLGSPVILPVAFGAGAVHGCACGGLEVCGQVSKKAHEEGDCLSACCTCCCFPCICVAGTIAGTGEKAIKYATAVIRFITSSGDSTASENATASEDAPND